MKEIPLDMYIGTDYVYQLMLNIYIYRISNLFDSQRYVDIFGIQNNVRKVKLHFDMCVVPFYGSRLRRFE